nr:50S ribosomal protein L25 [uncultured Desulfobulbus sp.]
MIQVNLDSAVRTVFGKGPMRQLRMQEMTPANLYSGGSQPVPLQFETAALFKGLLNIHGRNAVVTLKIEGDSKPERNVLVQEIQKDPITGGLIHVDFLEIALDKPMKFTVPLKYTGVAKGVDLGGDLQVFKETVVLQGCPMDIPDMIETDITPLERGGAGITYGDLAVPEAVEMLEKATTVCVSVS